MATRVLTQVIDPCPPPPCPPPVPSVFCPPCRPCDQGCCCEEIKFQGMVAQDITTDGCEIITECPSESDASACVPKHCYAVLGFGVSWEPAGSCITNLAEPHGGIKQYEFYLFGSCGGIPDRTSTDFDIASSILWSRSELHPCDEGLDCGWAFDEEICIIVRANDDAEIARCYACVRGNDVECSSSSSSSSSSGGPQPPSSSSSAPPSSSSSSSLP